ncbi:MAG: carbon-nitrogen family hydrolase [Phycisphaerae bacterium]|nr:carbon-nitrogen family hydrolase [Phycisphaerae bacterium]
MRAHLVQLDIRWEDKKANYTRVHEMVASAKPAKGDLVVLPEVFDTGFTIDLLKSPDADGATLAFQKELAAKWAVTVHGCRTVKGTDGKGRNRSTITGPTGETLAEYDKHHPFSLGPEGKRESDCFTPGDKLALYDWRSGTQSIRVCPVICYDLRFPELFRRGLAAGAEMYIVPANWPDTRVHHWKTLLTARAIENQAFVLGCNRAGRDPALKYPGATIAIGPMGEILAEADEKEQVVSVEIDRKLVDSWRAKFPAWKEAPRAVELR